MNQIHDTDQLCVNTIRMLTVDAVQAANSGHPGMPMGAAAMAYTLWTRFLKKPLSRPGRNKAGRRSYRFEPASVLAVPASRTRRPLMGSPLVKQKANGPRKPSDGRWMRQIVEVKNECSNINYLNMRKSNMKGGDLYAEMWNLWR